MISISVKETRNLREKIIGLIGVKPYSLLIKTHFGIHTFGLKFPIDVLILDNNNKVVSTRENLKPNRIFVWHPRYGKVIELPSGIIEKKKIKTNDLIEVRLSA